MTPATRAARDAITERIRKTVCMVVAIPDALREEKDSGYFVPCSHLASSSSRFGSTKRAERGLVSGQKMTRP